LILKVDEEGFLIDRDDWTKNAMLELALAEGVILTSAHVKYIMAAREMYADNRTVPSIREFAKHFGMSRKARELYQLFETSPMKRIAKWGGLPKTHGCL